jgi:hypothetical protein
VHQKIGRRKVPITAVRGDEGGVERAGRNARKAQSERGDSRHGRDARLDRRKAIETTLGAGERGAGQMITGTGRDRHPIEGGAVARRREEQLVAHRRVERSNQRPARAHQSRGDHPVRQSREIRAGAVDRIDDPNLRASQSHRVVLRLFGKPASVTDRQQALPQQRIDGNIGLAHRRRDAFDPVHRLTAKCLQRQRAGLAHGQSKTITQERAVEVIGRQR